MENIEIKKLNLDIIIKEKLATCRKGILFINGLAVLRTLEPTDRRLHRSDSLAYIQKIKVPKKTAIPYGVYSVSLVYSQRFKRIVPLLSGVPGFAGIEIHVGNSSVDTEGCILVGSVDRPKEDYIGWSKTAMDILMNVLNLHPYSGIVLTIKE